MGRLDYQSDNDNDYTESLFERNEDISDNTADELFEMQREDKKLLRDQWAKLDTANNIRGDEYLKEARRR